MASEAPPPLQMSRVGTAAPPTANHPLPQEYSMDSMVSEEEERLEICWWCRCQRLWCGPCCERPSQPYSVRSSDCALNLVAWLTGMHVGSQKFNRALSNTVLKLGFYKHPGFDRRRKVLSTDIKISSTHVQGLDIPVRVFTPTNLSSEDNIMQMQVILYLHEGGLTFMRPTMESIHLFCSELAVSTNRIVVAPSFRLAPEHVFPAALEDCFDVYEFLSKNSDHSTKVLQRADLSSGIAIVGSSAGGQLGLVLATLIRDCIGSNLANLPQVPSLRVTKLILLQPALMMDRYVEDNGKHWKKNAYFLDKPLYHFFNQSYVPGKTLRDTYMRIAEDRRISPILGGFHGLPRTVITCADQDPLYPQQLIAFDHMRQSGISAELWEFPGQIHMFQGYLNLAATKQLLEKLKLEFSTHV